MLIFIVIAVVGNFYFFIFLRLTWKFLGLENERECSICWLNNKIIDIAVRPGTITALHVADFCFS